MSLLRRNSRHLHIYVTLRNFHSSIYCSTAYSLNQNVNDLHTVSLSNAKQRNAMNGYINERKSLLSGSTQHAQIRKWMNQQDTSSSAVYELLLNDTSGEYYVSVYGAAMQKIGQKPYNLKMVKHVMHLLYERQIEHDEAIYGILFNIFATLDCNHESLPFLRRMLNEDDITPNIITATTLIKGCKKRGDVKFAEYVWNDVILKHQLEPNEMTYTEMIAVYAQKGDCKSAQRTFTQMLESGIKPNIRSCTALMSAFAKVGDSRKVIKLKQFCDAQHIEVNGITFVVIMSAFLKDGKPRKALDIYDQCVANSHRIGEELIGLKASAYLQILQQCKREIRQSTLGETEMHETLTTAHGALISAEEVRKKSMVTSNAFKKEK